MVDLRSLGYFVAVAEELNVSRAAARLHMSQPPLSRAIQQLEVDLGAELFTRSAQGMTLTPAGHVLLPEARDLLARAGSLPSLIAPAADMRTITIGTLADSVDRAGGTLIDAFRSRYPGVEIRIVEGDLTNPTVGVDRGHTDVALTRGPFRSPAVAVAELRRDPVGVVLRDDDPLATRDRVELDELRDRRWFRVPDGADPLWRDYWSGGRTHAAHTDTVVRTVRECVQAVLWSGCIGLAPLTITRQPGVVVVPMDGVAPSPLVVAWRRRDRRPLVHGFVDIATTAARRSRP
ncbi:LysR family transcriptional regulator [Spirilliplanes yamanashiensis]|uniref:LysR family transcriptional regulator n=1 Tax=Spirilliplanes yamanashiensis TaxID=42233 RepID=A0A8J4DLN4_9ACTN|nr:LysR family transcriptional regulator [Spirilliplanes yamanashiensis]MDP9819124.1 DNA-binding transcriptional LysR family regulator [Spirilliplanes yamanashiensis]GIJ05578.1 LysR family transcriptional regulator [Spirilliplanes yamanashiensis]